MMPLLEVHRERLRRLLQAPLPGLAAQERMMGRVRPMPPRIPADARPSAVLALLMPDGNDGLSLLLMERTADGKAHSGQISLPGGRWEPTDSDYQTTALREAYEEVGIRMQEVDVLGGLTPLYIPVSNFLVHPFVGVLSERAALHPSPDEVSRTLEVSLDFLFHEERKIVTEVRPSSVPGLVMKVPAYQLADGTIVWGATAMILSELEVLWKDGI